MAARELHNPTEDVMSHILKVSIIGATAICVSLASPRESKAEVASCPSPIPLGLTTALTGNLALLGTQARKPVLFGIASH